MPATLTTPPLGASVPLRMAMPPPDMDRVAERMDDVAVGGGWIERGQVLRHRLPGHREAVPVQQSGVEQFAP